jgi:hypothetical protein
MIKLLDSTGHLVKEFDSYQAALSYKFTFGNSGWIIKD